MALALLAGAAAALSPTAQPAPRHAPRHARRCASDATASASWRDDEDWALTDELPAFTVGDGDHAATFFSALASYHPRLSRRSAAECEARADELALAHGRVPPVLKSWARLEDGRFSGSTEGGRSVSFVVNSEGSLASGLGYVETIGGNIYELGEQQAAMAASHEEVMPSSRLRDSDADGESVVESTDDAKLGPLDVVRIASCAVGALVILQLVLLGVSSSFSGYEIA